MTAPERHYGFTQSGQPIVPPQGWTLLAADEHVPAVHREYIEDIPRMGVDPAG